MNSVKINKFPALSYATDEAINTLCTNLSFAGSNVKKIMFTSTRAGEGKSFLAMNVMRTMAKLGGRVVLVDCDLRRSTISGRYGFQFRDEEHRSGLAHYLAGMAELEDVLYETNVYKACVIPVGRDISNPLRLLNSVRFKRLLDTLAERFDYVIVDAPPVGTVIDAAQIAKFCDGTIVAVAYNAIGRRELQEVKAQLEQTGCPILGVVLNMVEFDDYLSKKYYYRNYYSYYGEYYGEEDSSRRTKKKSKKQKPAEG
ncbi:MAG: CpsD/CapB family tyrosine-protein kinase [Clostridia bacterium]|nr:CpsD/CapB family tyrosine-protein kinase [Clostridia bacterium]